MDRTRERYYDDVSKKAIGSELVWNRETRYPSDSHVCEIIPFPQQESPEPINWGFSRSDSVFAVALAVLCTTLVCLAPALMSVLF